jgi:hypothetical protein
MLLAMYMHTKGTASRTYGSTAMLNISLLSCDAGDQVQSARSGCGNRLHLSITRLAIFSMSNNQVQIPGSPVLPFYVAAYEGRAVAIKRDVSYQVRVATATTLAGAGTNPPISRLQ